MKPVLSPYRNGITVIVKKENVVLLKHNHKKYTGIFAISVNGVVGWYLYEKSGINTDRIDPKFNDYACDIQQRIHNAGFYVDVDDSTHTLGKKVREAQLSQYNLILVVGEEEVLSNTVCVRVRDRNQQYKITVSDVIAKMTVMSNTYTEYLFE